MEERGRGKRNLKNKEDSKMDGARYIYCITEGNEKITFGDIGIEGNEVYTILYRDLCAVVHNCLPEPYKSEKKDEIVSWVTIHDKVVEVVWEKFGTVLPLGFDTIIKGEEGITPDENTNNWLKNDYENLKQKLAKLKNRAEFGVQVFWDPNIISQGLLEENLEIKKLSEDIKSKSKGLAYMYMQKLENLLKKELEKEADRYFKDFYEQIIRCVEQVNVEKTKKTEEGKQMLLNFSCLLLKENSAILGEELEKIDNLKGFSVHFTGPWPPYSFT